MQQKICVKHFPGSPALIFQVLSSLQDILICFPLHPRRRISPPNSPVLTSHCAAQATEELRVSLCGLVCSDGLGLLSSLRIDGAPA